MARCHLLRLLRGPEGAAVAFYRWVSAYRNGRDGEDNAFDAFPDDVRSRMRANAASTFAEMRPGSGSGGEHLSRHTLALVRCPVTLVRGGPSQPVFRRALGFAARHLPDASTVELPSASHAIPTDCPRDLANVVVGEDPCGGASWPGRFISPLLPTPKPLDLRDLLASAVTSSTSPTIS